MKNALSLSQEGFDQLLSWLDPDRDQAGNKYEAIRRRLIKLFVCRGSDDPEGLADLTFDRVVSKVETIREGYTGDPALYFYGVANNIFREELRRTVVTTEISPSLPVVAPERHDSYSDQVPDDEDFCWAVHLDNLHPGGYTISDPGVTPRVVINNGTFYSRRVTDPQKYKPELKKGPKDAIKEKIAADIGVAIDPAYEEDIPNADPRSDNTILLEWSVKGQNYCRALNRLEAKQYFLTIINDPMPPQPPHEELQYYYKVIRDKNGNCFPPSQQCELPPPTSIPTGCDPLVIRNSLDIPCMPVVGGGSRG